MEKNVFLFFGSFNLLVLFIGLCLGVLLVVGIIVENLVKNSEEMLVVEVVLFLFYFFGVFVDFKFNKLLVDIICIIIVILEQVIKDQGVINLIDVFKNVFGVGVFYVGENGSLIIGDVIFMCGVDIFNSIYVDGICDIGSVMCDIFNIQQVEVIKGFVGMDYGCSVFFGLINMISKQLCFDFGIDGLVSIGSVWLCWGIFDLNQVFSDNVVFCLNLMGEKIYDVGWDCIENECYGIVLLLVFGFDILICLYLNYLYVWQNNILDGGIFIVGLLGYLVFLLKYVVFNFIGKVDISNFYGIDFDYDKFIIDSGILCFEYDLMENIIVCNIICWL